MNITFDELHIQNFQSIGVATLSLSKRGVVTVTGVNNYDDNTQSNGSGKSSIFASLFWSLYGKTPEGIIDPTNKYTGEICSVSLDFMVDNNRYKVVRQIRGGSQSVYLEINGTDQSGRNKTDSDRIIRNDVLHMSADIFLSLVYLSQGFATRLSSLSPSARKDRLEQLTNTAELIEQLSAQVADRKSTLSQQIQVFRDQISRNEGSISSLTATIVELTNRLNCPQPSTIYTDETGQVYTSTDIGPLNDQIQRISYQENSMRQSFSEMSQKRQNVLDQIRTAQLSINDHTSRKLDALASLESIQYQGICPTCNQPLPQENKEALDLEYSHIVSESSAVIAEHTQTLNLLESNKQSIDEQLQQLSESLNNIAKERIRLQNIVSKIPVVKVIDTESIQADIDNYTKDCEKLQANNVNLTESLSQTSISFDIVTHCQQLITKSFRSYLLTNIVNYMNARLKEYSSALFSNASDIISISADSQKLDIRLGDADYVTLSGGERRKVDLATMLAQRDLAAELAGVSCNLLVLDEIMESMDETATQVTLDLLESRSDTVDSMFIISHNNYALPVDSRITVTKNADRISTVTDI